MPSQPELIFVAGPQAGRREVLMTSPAVVGRDPRADVNVTEEAVSRQHIRFDLLAQGWAMTNLSSNGTVVNSKRYKSSKKQVLLDTGDVLQIGAQTQILYVGPEDDPDQALRSWREIAPPARAIIEDEPDQAPGPSDELEEVDIEQIDPEAAARQAKVRKYAIGGGIYLLAMVVLVIVLSNLGGEDVETAAGQPRMLETNEIARILDHRYELATQDAAAGKMLEEALTTYDRRHDKPGNLFRTVKYFQLHLAYKATPSFDDPEHLRKYNTALRKLTERATDLYKRAYIATNAQDYRLALSLWKQLQGMLPVNEPPMRQPDHPLFKNVIDYIVYVSKLQAAQK
ncbi:MAG: FHA domain-containing protein [Phycisphaerae bacterium]